MFKLVAQRFVNACASLCTSIHRASQPPVYCVHSRCRAPSAPGGDWRCSYCCLAFRRSSVQAVAAPSPNRSQHRASRAGNRRADFVAHTSLRLRPHPGSPAASRDVWPGWQLTTSRDYLIDTPQTDNDRVNYALSASLGSGASGSSSRRAVTAQQNSRERSFVTGSSSGGSAQQ